MRLTCIVHVWTFCRYVKGKISLAPNNPSAWNYLRGILTKTTTPLSAVSKFVKPLTVSSREELPKNDVVDLEDPLPEEGAELPCTEALEFLADVYEAQGQEGVNSAVEVCHNSPLTTTIALNQSDLDLEAPCH